MDAKQLTDNIISVLDGVMAWEDLHIKEIKTLEEANIRLFHNGIFLRCADKDGTISEFQITVVKSK